MGTYSGRNEGGPVNRTTVARKKRSGSSIRGGESRVHVSLDNADTVTEGGPLKPAFGLSGFE